jgi:hypothetical protein
MLYIAIAGTLIAFLALVVGASLLIFAGFPGWLYGDRSAKNSATDEAKDTETQRQSD